MADTANTYELDPALIEWLHSARPEHLACRDMRHAWKWAKWVGENASRGRVWARTLECLHGCGVTRIDYRDFTTREFVGRRYLYPEPNEGQGYRLPAGVGALTADDIFDYTIAQQQKRRRKGGQ